MFSVWQFVLTSVLVAMTEFYNRITSRLFSCRGQTIWDHFLIRAVNKLITVVRNSTSSEKIRARE